MTPAAGRRPAKVARELGVSPSTLRRWSQQFGDFLSPEAGNPSLQSTGRIAHRRYDSTDVETLERVRSLMQEGLTAEEIRTRLVPDVAPEAQPETVDDNDGMEEEALSEILADDSLALVLDTEDKAALDIGRLVSNTMASLSDSQKIILGGQQTAKQLLGVLLQDNFNLKEENVRLRERMVDTERRVYEMKRELDENRSVERDRMRQMEAHLFDLQRRLDMMAEQRAVVRQAQVAQQPVSPPQPAPVSAPFQPPAPDPPVANPTVVEFTDAAAQTDSVPPMQTEPQPEAGEQRESIQEEIPERPETPETTVATNATKRGFWAWLWGK
jgi:DNA-binding transcriptional MerR regulator